MFCSHARSGVIPGLLVVGAFIISLAGCGGGTDTGSHFVPGGSQNVNGSNVSTWARVNPDNSVMSVGATIPFSLIQNPPGQPGGGPAGAIATLAFPAQVQSTTYFNHLELHWNPNGHPPAFTMLPNFDLHFYGVTPQEVLQVTSPDPMDPAADHVPSNYVYPPASDTVPEMGRHAHNPADYQGDFTKVMVVGFYNGQMTFLEPTLRQIYLQQKLNFTLSVPRPLVLGRATRYPTTFTATYDPVRDSYTFEFSDFVSAQ